jgi:hypothetical protein
VDAGREVVEDPSVGGDHGDAQHERQGKPNPFAESWVRQVETEAKTHSDAVRSPEIQRRVAQEGSSYHIFTVGLNDGPDLLWGELLGDAIG